MTLADLLGGAQPGRGRSGHLDRGHIRVVGGRREGLHIGHESVEYQHGEAEEGDRHELVVTRADEALDDGFVEAGEEPEPEPEEEGERLAEGGGSASSSGFSDSTGPLVVLLRSPMPGAGSGRGCLTVLRVVSSSGGSSRRGRVPSGVASPRLGGGAPTISVCRSL
jgi:hypothetical protein